MSLIAGTLGTLSRAEDSKAEAIEGDLAHWIVQPKLDGIRTLMHVNDSEVRLTGRNMSESTFRLTEHQQAVTHLWSGLSCLSDTILDGEWISPTDIVDTEETVTTSRLQAAVAILAAEPMKAARIQDANDCRLQFHVFDLLRHDGKETTHLPLVQRLELLSQIIQRIDNEHIVLVPHFSVYKALVHERILENGGEGTVWKRLDQRPRELRDQA